jgi:signal transduction histidine kinase
MKSLYLRIWLTVVAALALFAVVSGWMVQRHIETQRLQAEAVLLERQAAWLDLLKRTLPPADATPAEQALALQEASWRFRVPMALDDAQGRRVAASESFLRRQLDQPELAWRLLSVPLDDGRTLRVPRPVPRGVGPQRTESPQGPAVWPWGPTGTGRIWPDGLGLAALLLLLLLAVAAGAWPVVRRLTRRLESLQRGVEAFGAGALHQRVAEEGRDEVAALAASFNHAAARIEALLRSHQSLLANASHELRSPLARLKMALSLLDDATPAQRDTLRREMAANIAELDVLVEEVLLASRLGAAVAELPVEPVDLLALTAEEAARQGVAAEGLEVSVPGDERLLRRAVRNLLENAHRYGGAAQGIRVQVLRVDQGAAEIRVCDRGPGIPPEWRERIFEPFFRLPGHAEQEGGVGLGLALVRQIAERHGGQARCEPREGGGSCFVLRLPGA